MPGGKLSPLQKPACFKIQRSLKVIVCCSVRVSTAEYAPLGSISQRGSNGRLKVACGREPSRADAFFSFCFTLVLSVSETRAEKGVCRLYGRLPVKIFKTLKMVVTLQKALYSLCSNPQFTLSTQQIYQRNKLNQPRAHSSVIW